ncbi:quinone oxidoreductase family protein [Plantibacter sp. YIM 135347]|uniref:quinone oxidoreductase family protein n=1 Tax=Plantibacter sp. YIM 135347 TaxID=3423919 RepID=UPI003D3374B7
MTQPGGPEVLRFTDVPIPDPGPGQVLIEVAYAGLNFTDSLARRGIPGYASGWPFVPGMEVSGRVARLGQGTTGFQGGERVVAFTVDGGGLAQFVVAESTLTVAIPDDLDAAVASSIPLTWATAIGLIRRSAVGPGDNVLITSAAGGVAHALAALLPRHQVGHIVGGVGSASKLRGLATSVTGVERGPGFITRAQHVAGDRPFDVILESVGGEILTDSLTAVAPGGTVVTYGAAAGQSDAASPTPGDFRTRNLTLAGFSIINLSRTVPERTRDLIAGVLALTQQDLTIPAPAIMNWDDAIVAHLEQSEGRAKGKAVVQVN